jgi:hypothetical protein
MGLGAVFAYLHTVNDCSGVFPSRTYAVNIVPSHYHNLRSGFEYRRPPDAVAKEKKRENTSHSMKYFYNSIKLSSITFA